MDNKKVISELQKRIVEFRYFISCCEDSGLTTLSTPKEILNIIVENVGTYMDQEICIGSGPDNLELRLDVEGYLVTLTLEDVDAVINSFEFSME